jgi:Ankyrin repeats (many copies)
VRFQELSMPSLAALLRFLLLIFTIFSSNDVVLSDEANAISGSPLAIMATVASSNPEAARIVATTRRRLEGELLQAAVEGDVPYMGNLLMLGVNASAQDKDGLTALHFAAHSNHSEAVLFLLGVGVNINAVDSDGITPLHVVARRERLCVCVSRKWRRGKVYDVIPLIHLSSSHSIPFT